MELPLIALKLKSFGWKNNEFRFLLILGTILLFAVLKVYAIPIIIIYYLIVSGVARFLLKSKTE